MKKHKIVTIFGFIISIVLLYLAMKGVNYRELYNTLKGADLRFVFISVPSIFLCCALSSYRWSKIAGNGTRFRDTFIALFSGLFINNVLPARIGEVVRGYVLSKRTGLSFTYSVTTVLLDRFFDLVGLLIITFVTFIFIPWNVLPQQVKLVVALLIALLISCVGLIFILSRKSLAGKVAERLRKVERPFISKLAKSVLDIQENLSRINSPLNLLFYVAVAVATWSSMGMTLYFTMLMLGVKLSFITVLFVCAGVNLGLIIPSSPGYVGVYQWLFRTLLTVFSISNEKALAVSIVFQATWYIPYTVLGAIFFIKEHLKIHDIEKLEENTEA
jgi:glycosyltransferase 2 family protein